MLGRLRPGSRAQGSTDCKVATHPGPARPARDSRSKPGQRSRIRFETKGATSGGAESIRKYGIVKLIPLTQGFYAMVDDEDYELLSVHKWHVSCLSWSTPNCRYAKRFVGRKSIFMHRQIIGAHDGQETDHINRDGLDNRRHNLRIATRSQNGFNRGMQSNNTSGETGVVWHRRNRKWQAQVMIQRKMKYLGQFVQMSDAIEARRKFNEALSV